MRKKSILDLIINVPGIGFNEIARRTNLSNGVVTHYILQLLKDEMIIKSGTRAKYFHYKVPEKDLKLLITLRNNTNRDIIEFLLSVEFPVTAKKITKAVKKSRSTVSVNLKKLEKMQIVRRKILNQNTKLTSDIGFYISNNEYVKKIFSKYNLDIKNEP